MKISRLIILFLFFCSFTNISFSQVYSDSSIVMKAYKTTPFTEVEIINKYGNIKILKNTTDSVKIEIKIKISTNDSLNLDNLIENIDFAFTESSQKLQVTTLFKPHKTAFLPSIKDFQKLPIGENKINIDYIVSLPEYSKLSLNNKYGDINIDEAKAELNIILSNGNLYCNKLHEDIHLELQFGKGEINEMKNGTLHLRYVPDFKLGTLNSVEVDSKSSILSINEANTLKIKSKRDHFSIQNVQNFYANVFFTNILICHLEKHLNQVSKHCELKIENIGKSIESFTLNSTYDILDLFFKKNASCYFEISEIKSNLDYSKKEFLLTQSKDSSNLETTIYRSPLSKKQTTQLTLTLNNSKLSLKRD